MNRRGWLNCALSFLTGTVLGRTPGAVAAPIAAPLTEKVVYRFTADAWRRIRWDDIQPGDLLLTVDVTENTGVLFLEMIRATSRPGSDAQCTITVEQPTENEMQAFRILIGGQCQCTYRAPRRAAQAS